MAEPGLRRGRGACPRRRSRPGEPQRRIGVGFQENCGDRRGTLPTPRSSLSDRGSLAPWKLPGPAYSVRGDFQHSRPTCLVYAGNQRAGKAPGALAGGGRVRPVPRSRISTHLLCPPSLFLGVSCVSPCPCLVSSLFLSCSLTLLTPCPVSRTAFVSVSASPRISVGEAPPPPPRPRKGTHTGRIRLFNKTTTGKQSELKSINLKKKKKTIHVSVNAFQMAALRRGWGRRGTGRPYVLEPQTQNTGGSASRGGPFPASHLGQQSLGRGTSSVLPSPPGRAPHLNSWSSSHDSVICWPLLP